MPAGATESQRGRESLFPNAGPAQRGGSQPSPRAAGGWSASGKTNTHREKRRTGSGAGLFPPFSRARLIAVPPLKSLLGTGLWDGWGVSPCHCWGASPAALGAQSGPGQQLQLTTQPTEPCCVQGKGSPGGGGKGRTARSAGLSPGDTAMCGPHPTHSRAPGHGKVISPLRPHRSRRGHLWCRWVVGIGVCESGVSDSASCVGRPAEKRPAGRCPCGQSPGIQLAPGSPSSPTLQV